MLTAQGSGSLTALRALAHSGAASRQRLEEALADLPPADLDVLLHDWSVWARDKQLWPEGQWRTWLILAGRGFGKTRTGAETVRLAKEHYGRIHLVAATAGDVRDVVVEGESGILAVSPPWDRPVYEPSKRRLTWGNGAVATVFSADEPDRLRGPQCAFAWADELAAWRYTEAWDQLMFGLRLGNDPRVVVTTTPRPTPIIRELLKAPTTHVTTGSTYENKANLAGAFLEQIVAKYEGTRLGRQELLAEVLDDVPGALWTHSQIDGLRKRPDQVPTLRRVVVAIDPAVTQTEESDETGLVVAGVGIDGHGYVLDDRSGKYSPDGWGREAVNLYRERQADRIVAEVNNGGDMVEMVIRTVDKNASYQKVHASRGKRTRAEPVAALYEQSRVHHVGAFPALEDQMCTWDASDPNAKSPDRMDALVWALSELMLDAVPEAYIIFGTPTQ